MIKVIYGSAGEGKTRECVREIESDNESINIGVVSTDGDFLNKLEWFGNEKKLADRNIRVFNYSLTLKEVLDSGYEFDMLVIDTHNNLDSIMQMLQNYNIKKIIITQQMGRNMGNNKFSL